MTKKYQSRFEVWVKEHYQTSNIFSQKIGYSCSSISKWINGTAFPDPQAIRAIWALTKDEIGPMYWYTEWPTEMRLRHESIDLLRSEKKSRI